MNELLTAENLDYRARAREVAEKFVRPLAAELDREARYPWEIIEKLKEYGLMGEWIPKEYGGGQGGVLNLCLIVEELSRACGGVGVAYAVNALGSFPIIFGGTEEQKGRWLPDIATGKRLISFGLSEPTAGSDAASLKTRAEKRGEGYVLNGDKKWNTNGGAAEIYTIFCVTDPERGTRGISAIVAEKGAPGFVIGRKEDLMGIRCVSVHNLHFRDCSIPAANLLGGKEGIGFALAMQTLDNARPGVAAQAVGLAQGALDLALEYARGREQFGQPIVSFQGLQFMLADMATQVEAARQLVYYSARLLDTGAKNVSKVAAMAKVFATDTAMRVTTDAVQLFGGYGYCKDYPIEKYMRDAKITQIYEGTNQIQRLVIARSLIKESASMEPRLVERREPTTVG
ncbi:MAG: acyl-CoA dehydrogenase family protein [Acidobacteriia bacterium]|nr:acyl-CoA dehydrogenase family protein [Terriglobia bacterium]